MHNSTSLSLTLQQQDITHWLSEPFSTLDEAEAAIDNGSSEALFLIIKTPSNEYVILSLGRRTYTRHEFNVMRGDLWQQGCDYAAMYWRSC